MNTVIFLGAGASKADSAPLQGELFYDYFSSDYFKNSHHEMDRELRTFFYYMFGIDVDSINENTVFPTFEEALGILDLCITRGESLKNYDGINIACNSNRLSHIRTHLVFMVAKIIEIKLEGKSLYHKRLVENLKKYNLINSCDFISTNYDILIDNALSKIQLYDINRINIDYGIENINYRASQGWQKARNNSIKLYKIHGSLNWLYCPVCNEIIITPNRKGVIDLINPDKNSLCPYCDEILLPVIVPPTYYKNMSSAALTAIWNKAERLLRDADQIIFCGYSFPDADMHIKYLLKRIETNRSKPLKIKVINYFNGKSDNIIKDELTRYNRFFIKNVDYIADCSFEDFASNPQKYI